MAIESYLDDREAHLWALVCIQLCSCIQFCNCIHMHQQGLQGHSIISQEGGKDIFVMYAYTTMRHAGRKAAA